MTEAEISELLETYRAAARRTHRPHKIPPESLTDNAHYSAVDLNDPKFIRFELRDGSVAEVAVTRDMRRALRDIRWLNENEKKLRGLLKSEGWRRLAAIAIARYDAEFRVSAIMPAAKAGWSTSRGGMKGGRAHRHSLERDRVLAAAKTHGWSRGTIPRGLPSRICEDLGLTVSDTNTTRIRRILKSDI